MRNWKMTDKLMAILALTTMITFLGVVAWFVPETDLIIVIGFVSLLAIYDFWQSFTKPGKHNDV